MVYRATEPPFIRMPKHSKILHKLSLKTLTSFPELKVRRRHQTIQFTELFKQQGLSARSPVAHFDEFIYSAQATLPKESDQLRLDRHQGLNARSPVAHFDELDYSTQATLPRSQISSGYIATKASAPGAQ